MTSVSTHAATARSINLALQGGGSHGAFTWGVLDTLLADDRIHIEGLSGTSAGAVNAVALAHGWATAAGGDPREAARAALARVWGQITAMGSLSSMQQQFVSMLWGGLPSEFAPTNILSQTFSGMFSPYQANPLDINPLRNLLEREIDFEAIGRIGGPKVFVSATHVNTGKAVVFKGKRLTAQAVMASACLPMLFRAVEIDGEHYWDGGYSGNPTMSPLISDCASADIVLVQINPLKRTEAPQSPHDIADRVNELTFNASLLAQLRGIEFVNRLVAGGWLEGSGRKAILLHRIDGGKAMQQYPASSKTSADAAMIHGLFSLGQTACRQWLASHFEALGARSTVNISRDYLDDARMANLKPAPTALPVATPGVAHGPASTPSVAHATQPATAGSPAVADSPPRPVAPVHPPATVSQASPPPIEKKKKKNFRALIGGLFKRRSK
jgi:NTE family protein